jgi:hypothetical protein
MFGLIKRIPYYVQRAPFKLKVGYQCLRAPYFTWVPPGHFYSPLPDMEEVNRRAPTIYGPPPASLEGIDLRSEQQAELLESFAGYYAQPPFERSCNPQTRFFRPNGSFPFQDAFVLYAMMRHLKPRRMIEIGCGHSSCVILDTCEALQLTTELTFIEPYPELLLSRIRAGDSSRFELRKEIIQNAPRDLFARLEAGDILFVDTSHVSKVGSDVNFILFEVLPVLKPGVVVHFHDVFYPFEYPREWLLKGMFWSEAYLLRAFLTFNDRFEIVMFNSYLRHWMPERLKARFPLFLEDPGASLWLRRC